MIYQLTNDQIKDLVITPAPQIVYDYSWYAFWLEQRETMNEPKLSNPNL
jgi:hypothetical protein